MNAGPNSGYVTGCESKNNTHSYIYYLHTEAIYLCTCVTAKHYLLFLRSSDMSHGIDSTEVSTGCCHS
jgi:hypothetical protein